MNHYYSDNDPHAAAWLGNLIEAGHLPAGRVDARDIREVTADDVRHHRQCHFFAGLGGWAVALELAGWPATRSIWSASLPCQPFSVAGKGKGEEDERHLWPVFRDLVAECLPATIAGEQVASAAGRDWYAGVCADLEALGYRVACADLCASCSGEEALGWFVLGDTVVQRPITLGPPHIRQRLYWIADRAMGDASITASQRDAGRVPGPQAEVDRTRLLDGRSPVGFADAGDGVPGGISVASGSRVRAGGPGADGQEARGSEEPGHQRQRLRPDAGDGGADAPGGLPKPAGTRRQRRQGAKVRSDAHGPIAGREQGTDGPVGAGEAGARRLGEPSREGLEERPGQPGDDGSQHPATQRTGGATFAHWRECELLACTDGKARRTQPGLFPLAHGTAFVLADGRTRKGVSRAKILRQIGNAIVPQAAAIFLRAYLECET